MATKPTLDDARWAETSGGTPASGITAPSSGKKDIGWVPAEKPAAQIFNHILHEAYKWFKYLSDGAFTGTHSFAGSTSFAGGLTGDTNSTGDHQADDFYHTDELEYVLNGSDFQWNGTNWTLIETEADGTPAFGYIESGAAADWATAPIHLPTDAVITRMVVTLDRATHTVSLGIVEGVVATGVASAVHINSALSTGGPGTQTYDSGALSYRIGVGLGGRSYEFAIKGDTGTICYGVVIKYTRPRP